MDIIDAAKGLFELFAGTPDADEPWAADEYRFEEHFGVSYEEFAERLELLSGDQHQRYKSTLTVNPEAAVLWVLSMDEV